MYINSALYILYFYGKICNRNGIDFKGIYRLDHGYITEQGYEAFGMPKVILLLVSHICGAILIYTYIHTYFSIFKRFVGRFRVLDYTYCFNYKLFILHALHTALPTYSMFVFYNIRHTHLLLW